MSCSNVNVWSIKAETDAPTIGYPCLDGGPYSFLRKSTKSNLRNQSNLPGFDYELGVSSCLISNVTTLVPNINQYAQLVISEQRNGLESSMTLSLYNSEFVADCTNAPPYPGGSCGVQCSCCGCCPEGGSYEIKKEDFNGKCTSKATDRFGTPPGCAGSYTTQGDFCPGAACFTANEELGDTFYVSCEKAELSRGYIESDSYGISTANGFVLTELEKLVTSEYTLGLARTMSSIKINIYSNNLPQNAEGLTCGEGKDACWIPFSAGSIANKNSLAQSYGIALSSDTKSKIEGEIFIYLGDGPSPCCDQEFTGEIIKQQKFVIYADSESFKGEKGTKIFFDNYIYNGPGGTIKYCIK